MDISDKDQIKDGFNKGYTLAKFLPGLALKLEEGIQDKDNAYSLGLSTGIKEAEQERARDLIKDRSKNYRIDTSPSIESAQRSKAKDVSKDIEF